MGRVKRNSIFIAMGIGLWTLLFNLAINSSLITVTHSSMTIVSVIVYITAYIFQLQQQLLPETATIIILLCSVI